MGLRATAAGEAWPKAPRLVLLPGGEVQVWRANLTSIVGHEHWLASLISEAERERANTFRQKLDRDRNMLARAALRDILGRYLNVDPKSLRFLLADRGKPFLDPARHLNAPRFSISHSGDVVLLAFAREHDIGVDVEMIRRDFDIKALAPQILAPAEIHELEEAPEPVRARAFFNAWTRKEAYLKARAEGIGGGLTRFAVTLMPGRPVRLIHDERFPEEVASWRIDDIPLGPDYAAATAIRSNGLRMRLWNW